MHRATRDLILPTAVVGSLPRPSWYTENLGSRSFLEAMATSSYREQYVDALSVYLRDQECAGLDIVTDGDCHFDNEVCGQSWTSYPIFHMAGFDHAQVEPRPHALGNLFRPGHILHDYLEARILPPLTGPVGRGNLQYTAMWKTAQRLTAKPVKFGTITPEIIAGSIEDRYYKDVRERIMAFSDALNQELHELADAGCPVIQLEEPQIHMAAIRPDRGGAVSPEFLVEAFNNTVKGLRAKTEVWAHTCWGNPAQQRMYQTVQHYAPGIEHFARLDADVITFESASSGHGEFSVIGGHLKDVKVAFGMIDHHTLQVERPEEIATAIRRALEQVPAERLVIVSDCGMGREGMSRRHARYKMVSLVQGTNIVRRELGLPEADCLLADGRYTLTVHTYDGSPGPKGRV